MTWQDARDWYRAWYAPNNAYVVVVGDVDHQAVFKLAEQTYGKHKAQPLPPRKPQNEPQQTGHAQGHRQGAGAAALHSDGLESAEADGYRQGSRALRTRGAVGAAGRQRRGAFPETPGARREARPVGGCRLRCARCAAKRCSCSPASPPTARRWPSWKRRCKPKCERIQEEGVTEEELTRVKTQTIAAQVYKRDSLMAQAMEIGQAEAAGMSWRDHRQADRQDSQRHRLTRCRPWRKNISPTTR